MVLLSGMMSFFLTLQVVKYHASNQQSKDQRNGVEPVQLELKKEEKDLKMATKAANTNQEEQNVVHKEENGNNVDPEKPPENIQNQEVEKPSVNMQNKKKSNPHDDPCYFDKTNPVNIMKDFTPKDNSVCKRLGSLNPEVKICVHDSVESVHQSKATSWGAEIQVVRVFRQLLRSDPELNVIDVGANIGQYSLIAAHAHRKVLAVDARLLHIHMINHAIQLNNYQDRITLVHNSIFDTYTKMFLGSFKGNEGGNYNDVETDRGSKAIQLQDLASVVDFPKALLRMNIEGFENRAMKCADKLFDKVFIPYVLMKWASMSLRQEEEVDPMLQWFNTRGYEVFSMTKEQLDTAEWSMWPHYVLFKHRTATF